MATLANRDDIEARLLKALGKADSAARKRVLDALGDPPDPNKLTADLMTAIEQDYGAALFTEMEKTFVAGAEAVQAELGIGFDWDVVNQRAADWARNYATGLAHDLTASRDRQLRDAVADFFEGRMDNRALTDKISRIYGPAKAETVAITEVTRAAAEGERVAISELASQGVRTVQIFQTSADDKVCAICGPMDGKRSDEGEFQFPPLHARCRCGVRSEVIIPDG